MHASCRVCVCGHDPAVVDVARAASSSYAAGLLAHLVEAGAAAPPPMPRWSQHRNEPAWTVGEQRHARGPAPRQVELLRGAAAVRGVVMLAAGASCEEEEAPPWWWCPGDGAPAWNRAFFLSGNAIFSIDAGLCAFR